MAEIPRAAEISENLLYCRMANFSVEQFSLMFHFWVFPFLIFPKSGHMSFSGFYFPVLCRFLSLVYQRVNING